MSCSPTITQKSALFAIALGLSGLAATSMPAAASPFSQFIHASPMSAQVLPHQGGPIGSQVGSLNQKPQVPTPVTTGAASQKPGSIFQKGPVPMSGSASSSPYGQTIGNNQQMKVPMPSVQSTGSIASQTIGNQQLKVPMATNPPLPPCMVTQTCKPIPPCEAGCNPNPPQPSTGPNLSINIVRPPVVYGSAPVVMPQAPMIVQQPTIAQRQPSAPQSQPVAAAGPMASEPASCLSKQYLNDGSALFRDNCTGEAAIASPAQLQAEAQSRAALAQGQTPVQAPLQSATN
jgi:hypothetical protein